LEFTLGEASGDYDGELYSDKTDRPPAENVPEYVPEVWEAGDEPSPSEIPVCVIWTVSPLYYIVIS